MRAIRPLPFLLLCLVGIGCHKDSPLVGAWEASTTGLRLTGTLRLHFNSNGTFRETLEFAAKNDVSLTMIGTWRLEHGNRLISHVDDITSTVVGTGPGVERARQRFSDQKANLVADANAHPIDILTWHGDDSFSDVNSKGVATTFRRAK